MAFQLSDDPNAALKQEITQAVALGSEADMDRLAERLKFANMAGATLNQLVERERDLNMKRRELDAQLAAEAERSAFRDAARRAESRDRDVYDDDVLHPLLLQADSEIAADPQYAGLNYDERLALAATAVRRYTNNRNGQEIDAQQYIRQRIADGKERGHGAPTMQATDTDEQVRFRDYLPSSEEKYHSSVIARMKAERLRGQGRGADGEVLEVDDEVDDED